MLICAFYLILTSVFLYLLIFKIFKKGTNNLVYLKNVPCKKPIFPFGNLLDFIGGPSVILSSMTKYLDEYGDTIIFHDGAFSSILVTRDYELNELLFTSSTHIDKARQYAYLHNWLGQGLLTSTGSKWRAHRKAITPSFHFSILQEFVDIFDNVGDNLVNKLKKEAGKDSVEISKIISLYALDVICEAAMGVKVNALNHETEYIKNIKTMCKIMMERSFSPLNPLFYPLTWNYYKEKKAIKVIHQHVDNVINKKIEEYNKEKTNACEQQTNIEDKCGVKKRLAFLDLLLNTTINGKPLSKEELRDEVNTFMFEGHDTTASAITFTLLVIATHPEVQQKVIEEQQEILGNEWKYTSPTYNQLNQMKYLDLVIKETLRLYPSVPYFGRTLVQDLDFKGTIYPKGYTVVLFIFAFQRSSKYFSDPEKFIPERFQDKSGKMPYSYTPFSAGPRNCIGQKFAMLEMLSTLSKIIRNFELGPANPEHSIQLSAETILVSKTGVRVSIKNRT